MSWRLFLIPSSAGFDQYLSEPKMKYFLPGVNRCSSKNFCCERPNPSRFRLAILLARTVLVKVPPSNGGKDSSPRPTDRWRHFRRPSRKFRSRSALKFPVSESRVLSSISLQVYVKKVRNSNERRNSIRTRRIISRAWERMLLHSGRRKGTAQKQFVIPRRSLSEARVSEFADFAVRGIVAVSVRARAGDAGRGRCAAASRVPREARDGFPSQLTQRGRDCIAHLRSRSSTNAKRNSMNLNKPDGNNLLDIQEFNKTFEEQRWWNLETNHGRKTNSRTIPEERKWITRRTREKKKKVEVIKYLTS